MVIELIEDEVKVTTCVYLSASLSPERGWFRFERLKR